MRMRLRTALLLALSVVGVVAVLPAHAESSPGAFSARLVGLINQARSDHGLRALTVASGTSSVAAAWTQHLASAGALSHNPDLGPQLESHGSPDWTTYGENVGEGPSSSADALFNAYMSSPEHRDNILGARFRYLGVGVVFSGSTAWNTLDFVDQYGTSSSTSTTPASSRPSSPRVTHHATAARNVTSAAPQPATRATNRTVRAQHTTAAPSSRTPASAPAQRPRRVVHHETSVVPAVPTAVTAAAPVAAPAAALLALPAHVPSPRPARPAAVALALLAFVAVAFARVNVLARVRRVRGA